MSFDPQQLVKQSEQAIGEELTTLIGKLKELAMGVKVLRYTDDGDEYIYLQPPDRTAAIYLIDRILGKPIAKVEAQHDHTLRVTMKLNDRTLGSQPQSPQTPAALPAEQVTDAEFVETAPTGPPKIRRAGRGPGSRLDSAPENGRSPELRRPQP